jgi:hypothetical protein
MLDRLAPLLSGRDTEIDMIEREMEGGVVVIQPLEVHDENVEQRAGGLISVEQRVDVSEFSPKPLVAPKA